MKRGPMPLLETLESRTLLSASTQVSGIHAATVGQYTMLHALTTTASVGTGVTLHLTSGDAFTGVVAFHPSAVLDPPLGLHASINWGDGTVSTGTVQYGTQGTIAGYEILGTHTYKKTGTFRIRTTLSTGPIVTPGQPAAKFPTHLLGTIVSKAIVAAPVSSGGVTINEIAGHAFTANIGSFTTIAPGTGLKATITWGDGTSSAGVLKSAGVIGIDVLKFDMEGPHTYATAGTYSIHVVVTKPSITLTAAPVQIAPTTTTDQTVATIDSKAIVATGSTSTISLAGSTSGTYRVSVPVPDAGTVYQFQGTGTVTPLGLMTISGHVTLPGLILQGHASGTLTLTNSNGSVTLALTGPTEDGFGSFPTTLAYTIAQASGLYAGDAASGSISVTLIPSATAGARTDSRSRSHNTAKTTCNLAVQ